MDLWRGLRQLSMKKLSQYGYSTRCRSLLGTLLFLGSTWSMVPAMAATEADVAFFDQSVHSILEKHCLECHGAGKSLRGGLRLSSREGILTGGDQGPAVQLDQPEKSLLLDMISYRDDHHQMPPDGKLSDADRATLTEWIRKGLPYNPEREIRGNTGEHEAPQFKNKVNDETRAYWAFQPIRKPTPPQVQDATWSANPIDAFIHARLSEKKLSPNPSALPRDLVRRAYYDLTGLAPSLVDVERFASHPTSEAWQRLVDQLLDSPQYGEKWGRFWLDLVRYAETNGYERDNPKPEVWRYRDYVIRAFNNDKPYNQFILEQLAGDELDEVTPDSLIATGFQRLGIWDDEPVDAEQAYYDTLDDVVATTGQVFLGLTINCARCHDHKIDPLPQRDYYKLTAFFHNTLKNIRESTFKKHAFTLNTTVPIADEVERAEHARKMRERQEEMRTRKEEIDALEKRIEAVFSNPEKEDAADERTRQTLLTKKAREALGKEEAARYKSLREDFEKLKKRNVPPLTSALAIQENGPQAPETHVFIRGNCHVPGDKVEPGFPEVLGFPDPHIPAPAPGAKTSGRRRVLAEWIASEKNPLTARVLVNRVWQFHFGRGIVRSPSDFGQIGDAPTHPELLDWLAATFMEEGWSLKKLHRRIMTSQAYRMASTGRPDALNVDPNNDLFWRFDMRRLTAEEIRDSILQLSGVLNLKQGGPWIYNPIPDEVLATASRPDHAWGHSPEEEANRRSIYIHVKRSLAEPFLKAFDQADTDTSCPVRFATTVPTQALTMINSEFMNSQAEKLAHRLIKEAGSDTRSQVRLALSLATSREPVPFEVNESLKLIQRLQAEHGLSTEEALNRFCLMTLNLNEFLFID